MRVTMSGVGRLLSCLYLARPEVPWERDRAGAAADFGTATHAEIASLALSNEPSAHIDARVRSTAQTFLEWFRERRDRDGWRWLIEPAYVIDLGFGEARLVGENIGRQYPELGPFDLAGSADLVGGDVGESGGQGVVIDVKTGRRENVEPVATNAQMRSLALAARLVHGFGSVRAILAFVGPSGVVTEEHVFTTADLDAWQSDLASLAESVPTSEPRTGKHCAYCPAKAACPAMGRAIEAVTPTLAKRLPIVTSKDALQGPDHARMQYETLRAAKTAIDAAWAAVRLYAEEHDGIDLGGGRVYGPKTTQRETIDLDSRAAVDALKSSLGESWQIAVSLETSKTAIKDAAKDRAKATGGKAAPIERATLEALRNVGAVRANTSTTFDEYARRPALTEGKTDA